MNYLDFEDDIKALDQSVQITHKAIKLLVNCLLGHASRAVGQAKFVP